MARETSSLTSYGLEVTALPLPLMAWIVENAPGVLGPA